MTPTPPPSPNDPRLPWLAGLTDGELPPDTARQLAEWAAHDPRAAEELQNQDALGPGNVPFWAAVDPEMPTAAEWATVRQAVADRLALHQPQPVRTGHRFAVGIGLAAAAAGVLMVLSQLSEPIPSQKIAAPAAAHDPLADFAVLPLAEAGDVRVEAVRPEDPDGPAPRFSTGPDEVPMIYARR